MCYRQDATTSLAQEIKAAGFRVWLAKRGTYGFYTNADGSRVVSFQFDLGGFSFTGQYKSSQPRQCGCGWGLQADSFEGMIQQYAPSWATNGFEYKFTTLDQYLASYGQSSGFVEVAE